MLTLERRAKIKWQCRRGMLELDLMLNRFIDLHLESLSEEALENFEHLLTQTDPELYVWLVGQEKAPKEFEKIVATIYAHSPHTVV